MIGGGLLSAYLLSVRRSFGKDLQEWFDTTTHEERKVSGKRFLVGTTTDVLKSIGVKDYQIFFGGSKIDKILTNNTSMTLDTIKDAVMLLEDPILIMQSQTVADSIVLFGDAYTDGGKPVMISVLLNLKTKSGEILDYAVITSTYGRRVNNVQNLIDKSDVYYVNQNKSRTEKWLQALGLHLPSAITKFGSIKRIPNVEAEVNGIVPQNLPMAATVKHVAQNMEEGEGRSNGNERPHELSITDIVSISKGMGHPAYIIKQRNGRYAEVVSFYNEKKKKVVVSVDFASEKNNYKYEQYMNGYKEGYYNIIVTQYEPDSISQYLKKNEIVYDRAKMNGKYQVGSGRIVTVTHDTPFISDIVSHSNEESKEILMKSSRNQTETNNFKRWFGDWQKHPENASKVVNADGTPKVVSHGTNAEFWTFDLVKSGSNYGDTSSGLFFFTNKKVDTRTVH